MRTRIIIPLLFFFALKSLRAQTFYITTDYGEIKLVDLSNCSTKQIANTGIIFSDIAICSGAPNIIYGIDGQSGNIYVTDTATGSTTLFNSQFSNQFGFGNHLVNSLVCDGNGHLYAADNLFSALYEFDIASGMWTYLGGLGGYLSAGDLTFFNGELYLTATTGELVQISLNPLGASAVATIDVPNVWGIITIIDTTIACKSEQFQMIGLSVDDIFHIDQNTGQGTFECQNLIALGSNIYGGASLTENISSATSTINISASPFTSVCPGESITLAVANSDPGVYSYSWMPGGATTTSVSVIPTTQTVYTVTATDVNGCEQTKKIVVDVKPLPNVTATSNTLCSGENGQLVVSGAATYSWSTGQTTASIVVSPPITTTYTVTGTHVNGCTKTVTTQVNISPSPILQKDSVPASCGTSNGIASVTASGAGSTYYYSWSGGGGSNATASNLAAGSYSVLVSNTNGCTSTETVTIISQGVLGLSFSPLDTVCPNQSTIISVTPNGNSPYTYSWSSGGTSSAVSVSPATTTMYTVFVSDVAGCSNTQSIQVVVDAKPLSLDVSPDSSICPGETIPLFAAASGGNGNVMYSWSPVTSTAQGFNVSPTVTTSYTVNIVDQCNVTAQQTILVNVDPLPKVLFSGMMPPSCTSICVDFTDQSTVASGNINNWNWNFGDGNNAIIQNPQHCYSVPGNYTVNLELTSDAGCVNDTSIVQSVSIAGGPSADFSFTPGEVDLDEPLVSFTNFSLGDSLTFSWNFGDPNDSTSTSDTSPDHAYSETGIYCVTLIAIDTLGCIDSIVKCLEVKPNWTIYFPNTFTPNGDGRNDFFVGFGTGIISYEMWVFDRWGNEIFKCSTETDPQNSTTCLWDGKVQSRNGSGGSSGTLAQIDTYVWLVELRDVFQSPHRVVGHVNLLK